MESIEREKQILNSLGFEISKEQPHISGERFLMTKNKLVLVGKRLRDNLEVAIKISSHPEGKVEINQEKVVRDFLSKLPFSKDTILFPREIYYGTLGTYLIWISEFIKQEKVFVAHSIEEQFFTTLRAFEAQEAFHATTLEHLKSVSKIFRIFNSEDYVKGFANFKKIILANYPNSTTEKILNEAEKLLQLNKSKINLYCNYLTHTDFVPHNFRIKNRSIYMLDCSSVYFGNKYEGWARFLNYMIIHNPELEEVLGEYVYRNRGEEEYLNLRLMRIYKIGFLLKYYSESLKKTEDDLYKLTLKRIEFWQNVLQTIIENKPLDKKILSEYTENRDALRSEEEKKRQREFAIAN